MLPNVKSQKKLENVFAATDNSLLVRYHEALQLGFELM